MDKLQIIILEDNDFEYQNTKQILEQYAVSYHCDFSITRCKNETELLDTYKSMTFDILFADIELKSSQNPSDIQSGITICQKLRTMGYPGEIFFLTNFKEYVFDGYEVHALNYLLKPITYTVFEKCMIQYNDLHSQDFYLYRNNQDYLKIKYSDIIRFTKEKNYILIQTTTQVYTERKLLDDILSLLPKNFIRCHKSCIVNMNHVQSLIKNQLHLSNNTWQPVGRTHLQNIRSYMTNLAKKNLLHIV